MPRFSALASALLIGFIISLLLLQSDERFILAMERAITRTCLQEFGFCGNGRVVSINLFGPSLVIEEVTARPLDGSTNWHWHAQSYTVSSSWIAALFYGRFPIDITLHKYCVHTAIRNGTLAMQKHLETLFSSLDLQLPIFIRHITMHHAQAHITDDDHGVHANCTWDSNTRLLHSTLASQIHIHNGNVNVFDSPYVAALRGDIYADVVDPEGNAQPEITIDLLCDCPLLNESNPCSIAGTWTPYKTRLRARTADYALVIDPLSYKQTGAIKCLADASLTLIKQFVPGLPVNGTAHLEAYVNARTAPVDTHVQLALTDVHLGPLANLAANVSGICTRDTQWRGNININPTPDTCLTGSWNYDSHYKTGNARANLCTRWSLPANWSIKPEHAHFNFYVQPNGTGYGSAAFDATRSEPPGNFAGTLTFTCAQHKLCVTGLIAGEPVHVRYQHTQSNAPVHISIGTPDAPLLYSTFDANTNTYHLTIDYALVHRLLPEPVRNDITGQGTLHATLVHNATGWSGSLSLEDASIKVPKMNNYLSALHAEIQFNEQDRTLVVRDVTCTLHRGTITSSRATFYFDPNWQLSYLHVPCIVEKVFMRWQRDLFAVLSGRLVMSGTMRDLLGQGLIIIERAQLKKNMLAPQVQKSMVVGPWHTPWLPQASVGIALFIATKFPLHIKTAFLDAKARVSISINGHVHDPQPGGIIELVGGTLHFPYRPLYITSGHIELSPGHENDPLISIVAHGTIKKYRVILRVEGAVSNPRVSFSSSPTLSQEQIIALLLAGSEVSSLQAAMPAVVMQNIEQLLFGPEQSESAIRHHVHTIFKPLKYIRLVPHFDDQSGRGGLRAGIEMALGDRLHALIQKNFSLPEDVRLEVDYILSDEVSVRAIRDERGDLGAELEVRWKFGG